MKRKLLFAAFFVASAWGWNLYAQFDANKTYTIVNRNETSLYVQDNSTGGVSMGDLNSNSYWIFEASGNTNCYYVKNATTGKYAQSCKNNEVEVSMGDTPVEYYIELKSVEGDGMYGLASTDQTTYNFTSGTIGWNWKNNNKVQGYAAVAGSNHRSFWKIVEQAMPTPDPTINYTPNQVDLNSLEQWMSGLNDNIYISQMSLPGAHDAAAKGILSGNCQDKDIAGLWDAGVRVFDLRPTDSGNDCTINHGILSTGVTLREALEAITGRLSANGTEFAIILMRKESGGDTWASKVSTVINSFSSYVMPFSPNLRLGDVRGKVLILSRDYFADNYTIDYWADNTARDVKSANGVDFVVQDDYEVDNASAKSTAITNLLTEARTNNSNFRMFINHTSGYTGSTGTDSNIKSNANTSNTLALNTINDNPGPTGIILMDYAGSSSYNGATLVSKIIEQNSKIAYSSPSTPETGQYYVYNVERDMYITRSNDYATRGGFDKAGMVIAVNNAGDGTLSLVTNVNGVGKGIFIADGNGETVYVDNTPTSWTFECIDNTKNIYTLKNGDKYLQAKNGGTILVADALPSNKAAQWQLVPVHVREDLSVASSSYPVDVTYLIENQGFDRYNGEQNSWKNADNSNWRPGDGWCRNADASNNCAEVWNANFDIHQSFTGLKNGVYELRVQGYYRISQGNNSDYLISQMKAGNNDVQRTKYYINSTEAYLLPQLSATLPAAYADNSVDINGTTYRYPNGKGTASKAFREGYYENEPIQTIVTDGNLTIGMKLDNKNGEDWNCFDNFRLYYLGLPDISQFTDALEAAITAAQAFSGKTTTVLQNALNTALEEAIAVRNSVDTDELTAKTNALNVARANAEAADVTFLSATIPLAQADGVDVTAANDVVANGTTAADVNNALSALRLNRRIANAETQADVFTGNEPAAGDFYLYNEGTGRFLCGGADWGAHAALGFPGILVTLEETGDGAFKINTHLTNGTDGGNKKEYLNYNGYCDTWTSESWKFISQGDGKYNIVRSAAESNLLGYEGGTYNNVITNCVTATGATNQWKLVTKADRDALLAKASETAPQDASYLIKSPNFSQREDVSDWTFTNTSIWGRNDNHPDFAIEAYNQTSASVEQTVTGLPAGTYELKVQAFYRDGNFTTQATTLANGGEARQLATLYAGTKSALIQNVSGGADQAPGMGRSSAAGYMPDGIDDACLYFQSGLYWATLDEIVVGQDGTMTIGARKTEKLNDGDWMVLDNFRLIYKGAGIDLSGVKADLLAKINEATTLLNDLGLNLSFLATAKNNGQDVYDNSQDADDIVDATNALQTAINQVNGATDMTVFKQTMAKAEPEGVAVNGYKAAVEAVTDGSAFAATVADQLYLLRSNRKVNALRMPDIYTGSAPAAGKVYLFNIGTGMFLGAGSDWNTHAAVDQVGIEVELVASGEGFTMKCAFGSFNDSPYVDTGANTVYTFQTVSGQTNVYNILEGSDLLGWNPNGKTDGKKYWNSISNVTGASAADPNYQWKVITPAERKVLLAQATTQNPVDVSYLINNPSHNRQAGYDMYTKVAPGGNGGARVSSQDDNNGDRAADFGYEFWNVDNLEWSQQLTGLTPGKYEVAVQGYYREGDGEYQKGVVNNGGTLLRKAYLKAGDETAELQNIAYCLDGVPGVGSAVSNNGAFPNWPREAFEYFETGYYWTSVQVTVGNDGQLKIGVYKDSKTSSDWIVLDNFRLRLLEADKASANMKITDAKYATFIAPFDVEIPASVTASTAAIGADDATLELTALDGTIPAHTAVILFSENTLTKEVSGVRVADPENLTTDALVGTYEDIQAPDGSYVLQNQGGKVGFYLVEQATAAPWVRANRAYLTAPANNPVKAYLFEDAVDAIKSVNADAGSAEIYNVAGQRMSKLQRGVNIVNGKKVMVK